MESHLSSARTAVVLFAGVVSLSSLIAGGVGAVEQAQQPTAEEILDRVEERYESAETVVVEAVVTTSNATGTTTANVSLAHASPDSVRLVVDRGEETYRFGTNGSVSWTVGPDDAAVWDAESPAQPGRDPFPGSEAATTWTVLDENETDNVSASLVGTTEVDSVPAYELELRPDAYDGRLTTLWVAQDDARVLRAETTDGTNRTVVEATQTRFNVSIHESTFQPPDDRLAAWSFDRYDSFDVAQDATTLDLPRLDGGTFTRATVTTQQGETVVSQQYEFDGENVTLVSTTSDRFGADGENASTVQLDGRNATVSDLGDRSAVVWTEDGVTTAVVVEGSTERAVEVTESLET